MKRELAYKTFCGISLIFVFFFVSEWCWEAILVDIVSSSVKPSIVSAIIGIMLIYMTLLHPDYHKAIWWIILFGVGYYILVAILNANELVDCYSYQLTTEFGVWIINIALFITASDGKIWNYVYSRPKLAIVLFVLYILPPVLILFFSGHAAEAHYNIRNLINIMWHWNIAYDGVHPGVSYQSFGDKIAILTFIIVTLRINKRAKLAVLATTLVALYIVGSKASMVGYIFACGAYYVISLYCHGRYEKCALLLSCLLCLLLCGLTYIINNPAMQYSDNWLISTVASGRKDISVSGRQAIEMENRKTRSSRLILGDYKFDYKLGRPGTYTHSALGIVDYYGVPIFLMSVGIWLYLLFKLMLLVRQRMPLVIAALMAMLFYTLLFIIARFPPINYLLYWTLGMAVCAISYSTKNF